MVEEHDDGTEYEDSAEDRRRARPRVTPATTTTTTTEQPENERGEAEDEAGCGPECRNLLHESEHRKEDAKCPYEGMVIDIYGYCR